MKRFVIGDLHGNYRGFMQVLKLSNFNYEKDLLISLGDIVDGYPDVWECTEELLKIKNLIAIKGNHDDWFLEFLEKGAHPVAWLQGGHSTLESYISHAERDIEIRSTMGGYVSKLTTMDIDPRHVEFYRNQKLHYTIDDIFFVHGGFNRHKHISEETDKFIFFWDRDLWNSALSYENSTQLYSFKMKDNFKEVYIGHTPTINWRTNLPIKAANVYNIDTGGGYKSGKVTIVDIDSQEFFQSDTGETLYPHHSGR